MKDLYLYLIFIPLAYIVGSINFATIISSLKNKDIRSLGSGNPGTMNMLRSVGKLWGCLTFILDFFKGVAFALIGMFVFKECPEVAMYSLGFVAVLGHIFSCFLKFKGGKGVATSLGVFAVIHPIVFAAAFASMIAYLVFCKKGFIGSLIAISVCVITNLVLVCIYRGCYYYINIVILCVWLPLIFLTHKDNFKRLFKKEENSLSLFGEQEQPQEDNKED